MNRAALEAATPAPPRRALTQDQIIEAVLLTDQLPPAERAFHHRPDSPIRAAMRGEIPAEAMARPERIAALIWANQGRRGTA
jgi:hypothetical protein